MDVSDRRMQVQLTQEAKIASDFFLIRAIFAFVGFVSALAPLAALRARGVPFVLYRAVRESSRRWFCTSCAKSPFFANSASNPPSSTMRP